MCSQFSARLRIGEVFYAFRGSRYINRSRAYAAQRFGVSLDAFIDCARIVKHLGDSSAPCKSVGKSNIGASRTLELSEPIHPAISGTSCCVSVVNWLVSLRLACSVHWRAVRQSLLSGTKAQLYLPTQNALESGITPCEIKRGLNRIRFLDACAHRKNPKMFLYRRNILQNRQKPHRIFTAAYILMPAPSV